MNIADKCLHFLSEKKWMELNQILSNESNCFELSSHPTFAIFESVLISEVERYELEGEDELLFSVVARIFQISEKENAPLTPSKECVERLASYLFLRNKTKEYAIHLPDNPEAIKFLNDLNTLQNQHIENSTLSANLNIKVGEAGQLNFSKSIFNDSPQERELFLIAQKLLSESLLLPNAALSTIINPKITKLLTPKAANYFYKSTLDLCVVDAKTFIPKFFVELDSSWHDEAGQIEKDEMKDEIFKIAGFPLHRLRKRVNKSMEEEFELFIKNYFHM